MDLSLNATKPSNAVEDTMSPMIGLIFLKKFMIVKKFEQQGQFGQLFIANYLQNQHREVFVKITTDLDMSKKEFKVLEALQQNDKTNFAELLGAGEFVIELLPIVSNNCMTTA